MEMRILADGDASIPAGRIRRKNAFVPADRAAAAKELLGKNDGFGSLIRTL